MTNKIIIKQKENEFGICSICKEMKEIVHLIIKPKTIKNQTTTRIKVCADCFGPIMDGFIGR